jgi:hypothetical protein
MHALAESLDEVDIDVHIGLPGAIAMELDDQVFCS